MTLASANEASWHAPAVSQPLFVLPSQSDHPGSHVSVQVPKPPLVLTVCVPAGTTSGQPPLLKPSVQPPPPPPKPKLQPVSSLGPHPLQAQRGSVSIVTTTIRRFAIGHRMEPRFSKS